MTTPGVRITSMAIQDITIQLGAVTLRFIKYPLSRRTLRRHELRARFGGFGTVPSLFSPGKWGGV